ncbi:MAG: recombinase family protein [Thermodesulfovibrionales bacterium]|jgi:predicted site-specific integrase-resolvase
MWQYIDIKLSELAKRQGITYMTARVSRNDQKADLERQIAHLNEFAELRRLTEVDIGKETGSGLNGHRRALLRIFRNPAVRTVMVEHRDGLLKFGFE